MAAIALLVCGLAEISPLQAQIPNRVTWPIDITQMRSLPGHIPPWANSRALIGPVPPELMLDQLTVVLSRSPEQEQALDKFMADQQDPASPNYHHWLTPSEFGERFGLSEQDTTSVAAWLQSQGLQVNWISPSRTFIGFKGAAADVGRAFQTELRYYAVSGEQRISISSDPMLPEALAPVIKAVHGLYTLHPRPLHRAGLAQSAQPEYTNGSGNYYIVPADFVTIYDVPTNLTGAGVTIGIVGQARVNPADITSFDQKTGSTLTFTTANEVVPTALGGVDPGPAQTTYTGTWSEDQLEATLDVTRAGSVAPGANLLLVVATQASGGIGVDTQYLVQTVPVPAQVMSISFGLCETLAGQSGVNYWDALFQQAAAEGISVLVSSGDAGAAGCDENFQEPAPSPGAYANSANYICSSSYATCLGGTEFNDASNPSAYWSSSNRSNKESALSYIPEGGWNEPWYTTSPAVTEVAASGGGVSQYIATPSWQTGTGVPAARTGRYTPDISFSASCHDGYYACFAAAGNNCVSSFEYFCGTSASAPDMAGVTALLDQALGAAQGNLNPRLYAMAANSATASAFHDATPGTSGVTSCDVNTPSMCNNSIPGPSGLSGGQPGYAVTTGYDLVTGLGSLDVNNFILNFDSGLTAQTISFTPPASLTYGAAPFVLSATGGGSGNAVRLSLVSGPATLNTSNVLTITGAGTVVVTANQLGNSSYATAAQVTRNIVVNPAPLTVTATDFVLVQGTTIPALTYTITGFVNGDTKSKVVSGTATLTTTATTSSPAGTYPITYATENLMAANYTFNYLSGVLEVYNLTQAAVPLLLGLSPASATAAGGAFTLTVNGANFASNSLVLWNGAVRKTTYVSSTQLTATILAQDIAKESTSLITVVSPAPNAGTSSAQPLAVVSATPVATVNGSTIALAADGSGNHVISLLGTDFVSGSVVQWNGTSLAATCVSPWQILATITSADYAAQSAPITVINPAGTSTVFEMQ